MLIKQNKKEEQKGITLVALVVTIVVLLILAGITITALFSENGIIKKAQEAKNATEQDQLDTAQGLKNLEEAMGIATGDLAWKVSSDGKTVSNKYLNATLEIGDYVNYDCKTGVAEDKRTYASLTAKNGFTDQIFNLNDYNYGWRVLGVDNKGQLLLISEETVPITLADGSDNTFGSMWGEGGTRSCYFIQGKVAYENVIKELENISKLYGQGKGATGGTVLKIEDVDKFTGLNGNNIDGKGTKSQKGHLEEYGNKVTYYWDGTDKPYYETSNGLKGKLGTAHNTFNWYDENNEFHTSTKPTDLTVQTTNVNEMKKITTLTNDLYIYSASDGMEKNSKAYKMLFTNSSTGINSDNANSESGVIYYLGSSSISTVLSAGFGLCTISDGAVFGCNPRGESQYYGDGSEGFDYCGVRPVVSLKSNISLKLREGELRDNCNIYDIVE